MILNKDRCPELWKTLGELPPKYAAAKLHLLEAVALSDLLADPLDPLGCLLDFQRRMTARAEAVETDDDEHWIRVLTDLAITDLMSEAESS